LVFAGNVLADEEQATAKSENDLPAHRVVFRVSEDVLNSLLGNNDIDRQTNVRDVILGTTIYGTARVVGKPGIQLIEKPDQATFHLTFQGTAQSRTTGYNGPAIIYSRTVTTFSATKQVVFEPGQGFRALPAQVTAQTRVFLEGIGSQRGGLIGRIVRRRAGQIAEERRPLTTEIARQKAEQRIAFALDRGGEERLARLNGMAQFRSTLAALLMPVANGQPKYACCTTPYYVQIATNFGGGGSAIELPVATSADADGPAVEIWVHDSLGGERVANALDLLTAQFTARDVLTAISAAVQVIGEHQQPDSQFVSLVSAQPIRLQKTGPWRVIKLDIPTEAPQIVAKPPASRTVTVASTTPTAAPAASRASVARPGNRTWTSGPYHAEAEFVALEGNMVRLQRTTGVRTSIPIEKLSADDQEWIRHYLVLR